MENQLETGILSLDDADFNSLLMGVAPTTQTAQPNVEENNNNSVDRQEAIAQIPIEESHIAPLDSLDFDELSSVIKDKESTDNNTSEPQADTEEPSTDNTESLEVSALKNIAEFFIEKGVWDDFENRESFNFEDQEAVANLLVEQTEKKAYDYLGQLIESTGPYGKAIIEYAQNGGNPDELIDLFKAEKAAVSTDISTDEGKKAFIQDYYINVANMKPERAKKVVEALELENELDNELSDVKQQYEEYYRQEREALAEQTKARAAQEREQQEQFRNSLITEVSKRNDLTDKQRRQLAEAVLVDDYELPDGTRTTKLHASLATVRNNMNDYLEFVEFVTDKENYKKRLITQTKNQNKVETFNFLKSNNSAPKKTGSSGGIPQQKETTFKFI